MELSPEIKLQGETPPGPEDFSEGVCVSPDMHRAQRIPPSQSRTKKWPVLDTGIHPKPIVPEDVTLELYGEVEAPVLLTWAELQNLPKTSVAADMHCVTRWSRLGNLWEGISTQTLLAQVRLKPTAKYVMVYGRDEVTFFRGGSATWSTNLPLEYFSHDDCLVAWSHDGEPLSNEHGGPLRLVVPKLYAWKSAKWVCAIEFKAEDAPGYWEKGGYHMLGDPWKEQRFRFSEETGDAL
ncbi:molybdopterin-dependent oxidoreductase [Armatimonas sp.]|uniref:molybdopterin-dependent oxidoreductase n=1 Tax=Armatimonas sp. TaxID=1872638 RepID=UPI00286AB36B|nr:molybdopterin-dependent oxidoreductase [Armatimonas sp.]